MSTIIIHSKPSESSIKEFTIEINNWFNKNPDRTDAVVQFPWGGERNIRRERIEEDVRTYCNGE